jgi:starch synthase
MLKELKQYAKGSATPILFHGWLDNVSDQYISLLSEASIFCLVSAKENASTSLMEGLSAGCAVITSNVSGCPETVGDAGICIAPADVLALKKALKKLVANDELRISLMQKGRERAIREFGWEAIAQRYLNLFSQIKSS